jgi:hypothetical protein
MTPAIIDKIQRIVRCYPDTAPESATLPYSYYSYTRNAIHTREGIAGYEGVLSVAVVAENKAQATTLSERIIDALNGKEFGGIILLYSELSESDMVDAGLSVIEINFNYF